MSVCASRSSPRVSPVVIVSFFFVFLQSLIPRLLGRRIEKNFFQLAPRIIRIMRGTRGGTVRRSVPPIQGGKGLPDFNAREVRMGETPSANTHSKRAQPGEDRRDARLRRGLRGPSGPERGRMRRDCTRTRPPPT